MNIEFLDELPTSIRRSVRRYQAFSNACKDNPGKWAKLPKTFPPKSKSMSGTSNAIRKGHYDAFQGPGWESAMRGTSIYVRYVGE